MTTASDVTATPARPPRAVHRLLFAGEHGATYDSMLRRVSETIKPADLLEEVWLQDVVDLSWEVERLRHSKAEFLNSSAHRGLRKVLEPLLGGKQGQDLAAQWAAHDPKARKLVASTLAAAGMSMSTVMAHTLAGALGEVERFERLTAAAELRRNAMIREIAQYRSVFAAHLQRATDAIEDAEFKVVESRPGLPAGGSARDSARDSA